MRFDLTGVVVPDDDAEFLRWFGVACTGPKELRNALKQAEDAGEELEIWINSTGGDVWAASEMYTALKESVVPVKATVAGLSASAATIVMMAADRIEASPTSMVMVHLPSTRSDGDYRDLSRSIEMLQAATEGMLTAYERRTGLDRATLKNLLEHSSWLSAERAVELGFVDSIVEEEIELRVVASFDPMGGALQRMREIYDAAQKKTELTGSRVYVGSLEEDRVAISQQDDKKVIKSDSDWQKRAEARVALEGMRYGVYSISSEVMADEEED